MRIELICEKHPDGDLAHGARVIDGDDLRSPPQVLSKYRSGKLPKAFKIIPALSNWEQILYVTEPEAWTAAAMYQATRWSRWGFGWPGVCR